MKNIRIPTNGQRICSRIGCFHSARGVVRVVFYTEGREQPAGSGLVNLPLCSTHLVGSPLDLLGADSFAHLAAVVQQKVPQWPFVLERARIEAVGFDELAALIKGAGFAP